MGKKKSKYICTCFKLTKKDMKEEIIEGVTDFKDLQKRTKIGTKCSSCKKKNKNRFLKYLKKYNKNESVS